MCIGKWIQIARSLRHFNGTFSTFSAYPMLGGVYVLQLLR